MGIFDFKAKKTLNPTIMEKDRPLTIINYIENITTDLFENHMMFEKFGDYRDGIRLQLILSYLDVINKEPAILEIDSTTVKHVILFYQDKHWVNESPNLSDLLSMLKISNNKMELMEIELIRTYSKKKGLEKDVPDCISFACFWLSGAPRTVPPGLEKKMLACELSYATSSIMSDVIGGIYGSKLLRDEANVLRNELKKRRDEFARLGN
jgi:hypothetical protein